MCLESFFCEAGLQCPESSEDGELSLEVAACIGHDKGGSNDKVQPRDAFSKLPYVRTERKSVFEAARKFGDAFREFTELRSSFRTVHPY
jgi:hypothetical protein